MNFRILLLTLLLGLTLSSAMAAPGPWGGYDPRYQPQQIEADPNALLREGVGKLVSFMRRTPRPDATEIVGFLNREIAPYFDFSYMTQWVAGRQYRYMNDQQRSVMEAQLKQLFLAALAQRLGSYQNQSMKFYPVRRARGNEVDVGVGILQAGNYPAKLNFRFYRGDDGWKVFDVSANGSSALVYYRQYFSRHMGSQRQRAW